VNAGYRLKNSVIKATTLASTFKTVSSKTANSGKRIHFLAVNLIVKTKEDI